MTFLDLRIFMNHFSWSAFDCRDILSDDYVRNAQAKLWNLPYWNGGRNHLIFNLFSGSWPDYSQDLGFDPGHALLAKSSAPEHTFRPG